MNHSYFSILFYDGAAGEGVNMGGHDGLHEFEYMVATVHVMLVVFFQPLGEYLAILLVSIDKASVARVAE